MTNKKHSQLGMNPSTAQHRLVKDILWSLIVKTNQHLCCKCNTEMSRDTFSIEHIEPWLDSKDPIGMFFDIKNISFSHKSCNFSTARRPEKWEDRDSYKEHKRKSNTDYQRSKYCPEKRKKRYLNTGH